MTAPVPQPGPQPVMTAPVSQPGPQPPPQAAAFSDSILSSISDPVTGEIIYRNDPRFNQISNQINTKSVADWAIKFANMTDAEKDAATPGWRPAPQTGPQPVQQPTAQPGQTVQAWPGGAGPGPGGIMALAPGATPMTQAPLALTPQ